MNRVEVGRRYRAKKREKLAQDPVLKEKVRKKRQVQNREYQASLRKDPVRLQESRSKDKVRTAKWRKTIKSDPTKSNSLSKFRAAKRDSRRRKRNREAMERIMNQECELLADSVRVATDDLVHAHLEEPAVVPSPLTEETLGALEGPQIAPEKKEAKEKGFYDSLLD